ncbi:symplekin-like [Manduca sexta]|uniref:symplekin-like n=1 Tax=Manduca sexta TaxID=7130 RepID=UPI00188DC81D|nr:symplekin-like [Manduca sexta]
MHIADSGSGSRVRRGGRGGQARRAARHRGPLRAAQWPGGPGAAGDPARGLHPACRARCCSAEPCSRARDLHILTEKAPPSPELVSRVRELYATRVSDVRFLIPVLTGLTKKEILAALPKLIKLNPVVVKEVFNKLLGLQNMHEERSPVSPTDLLVALHLIDPGTADLKYIIKATAMCFAEKQNYTQDVLSAVLQRLCEEPEIPVLMMRTVLQALTLYPSMAPLVLNILQLLIEKEVWQNKVAWEGWVKCCVRLLPAAVSGVARLPPAALGAVRAAPALCAALRPHLALLPPHLAHALAHLTPEQQYASPTPGSMPVPAPVPAPNPVEPLPPGME